MLDERKIQERIASWTKEQRLRGEEVKIGIGKVRINGIWKYWNVIEKEKEKWRGEGTTWIEIG